MSNSSLHFSAFCEDYSELVPGDHDGAHKEEAYAQGLSDDDKDRVLGCPRMP